ncbi:MAG TPA: hemolysin III family protein [Candidatus Limnocylindria bacterium]|nr:hemolysin III family protein [Candidatus Limnocylindria bacterium]
MPRSRVSGLVERPLLRGYLHAGAAVAAALGGTYLVVRSSGDRPQQLSMLVYGAGLTLLFAVSALYHVRTWAPARRAILRRIDHANIFVLIAATYTPITVNVFSGWWRVGILSAVWGLALAGVSAAVAGVQLPRWARAGLYVGMGWIALAALGQIAAVLPWPAIGLLITGGVLYSAGALLYAAKWPGLWPRVFGYHEAFHLMTIAAAGSFYVVMLVYVLGAPRP